MEQAISKAMCLHRKDKMEQRTVTEKRFGEYHEDDKSITLRSRSATCGGGFRGTRYLLYQDTVGAICFDDYKGPNRQYVEQGKLIICVKQ